MVPTIFTEGYCAKIFYVVCFFLRFLPYLVIFLKTFWVNRAGGRGVGSLYIRGFFKMVRKLTKKYKADVAKALRCAESGKAYHWPTIAAILADEVKRLRR